MVLGAMGAIVAGWVLPAGAVLQVLPEALCIAAVEVDVAARAEGAEDVHRQAVIVEARLRPSQRVARPGTGVVARHLAAPRPVALVEEPQGVRVAPREQVGGGEAVG